MRKTCIHISIILTTILLLTMFLFHSSVYATGLEVEIGSGQGTRGETVTIPIRLRNVPDTGIILCNFEIKYDTDILEALDGVTAGTVIKNAAATFDSITDKNSGTIKFLYNGKTDLGNESITTDGVFAYISFLIKQNVTFSSTIIMMGEPTFENTASENIKPVVIDGSVEVTRKPGYRVIGYIVPDMNFSSSSSAILKSGFKVGVTCSEMSTQTDQNGYFELLVTNCMPAKCTLTISKDGFLYREINNVCFCNFDGYTELSSAKAPVKMCAGDINNDKSINIIDIMNISKAFNSSKKDSNYNSECDVNKDDVVNMEDVMSVIRNFNKTTGDYQKI